jgi:GNAT superfamily N-acetyltransferase
MNRTQVARTESTRTEIARTGIAGTGGCAAAAIRPASQADLAALSDFFAGLSVESRYLRFFAPVTPTCGLLHLLSGGPANVDAIVAVEAGVIVGHAMAADRTDPEDPEDHEGRCGARATDVGVVVADAWQRRGVGAALMRALVARAQARGVTSLAMDVLPGNRKVLAMVIAHWPDAAIDRSPDSLDIRIPLPRQPQPRRPRPLPASGQAQPLVSVGR